MRSEPVSRFRVLTAALMLELCGGSIYLVGLYNDPLQQIFFSRNQSGQAIMEKLVFCCNIGNWLPIAGLFYDSKFGGPKSTVAVAAALTLIGYGGLCLCAMHPPTAPSSAYTVLLGVLFFCWGHGSGYFDCTAIATTAYNFPHERGSAVGVAKALYGLSGSLLTQVYQAFFNREPVGAHFPGFLAFQALFLSGLGASMIPCVRLVDSTDSMAIADKPRRRLKTGACVIIVLALALAAVGLLRSFTSLGKPPYAAQFSYAVFAMSVVGVLALWSMAWGASVSASDQALLPKDPADCAPIDDGGDVSPAPLINASAQEEARTHTSDGAVATATEEDLHTSPPPPLPPSGGAMAPLTNGTLMANVRSLNFWLIFVAFFGGAGGGLVFSNHVNYIVHAAYGPSRAAEADRVKNTLISLLSVCSCLGRLGFGMGSDAFQHHVTRPQLFAFATALMGASHALLLGASVVELLFIAAVCNGLSYGAFWALIPTLVGDLFGQRAFASTYNAFTIAVSGSSLLLSTELATLVAEAHTPPPQNASMPAPLCYGPGCYALTHTVVMTLCGVGVVTASILSVRTRTFYRERRPRLPRGSTRWRR